MKQRVTVEFYRQQILPRLVDVLMRWKPWASLRPGVVAGLRGEVLEVGFGSGLNLAHYPPGVGRILAVDPTSTGWRLARRRVSRSDVRVVFVRAEGEALPLAAASVDSVLTTWSLCCIQDPLRALDEIRRVLRPTGRFFFVEHGLSDHPGVAAWQKRLTPLQRRVAGGCHLDRKVDQLLEKAGFRIETLKRYTTRGPRVLGTMYQGIAVPVTGPGV